MAFSREKGILTSLPLLAGALLFYAGLAIPAYFHGVPRIVLEAISEDARIAPFIAEDLLGTGKTGSARLLYEAAGYLPDSVNTRIAKLEAANPEIRVAGGPAPYFGEVVERLGVEAFERPANGTEADGYPDGTDGTPEATGFAAQIIPREIRRELRDFLKFSSNVTVTTLLDTRTMTTVRFMPVTTAAGAPLDAAILTTALLAQGEHLSDGLQRDLRIAAEGANRGQDVSATRLEEAYLAILSLSKRLRYRELTEVIERVEDRGELLRLAALFRLKPDEPEKVFAMVVLSGEPGELARYLDLHGDEQGWAHLSLALNLGDTALSHLLETGASIHEPSGVGTVLGLERSPLARRLAHWTEANGNLAIALRIMLLVFGAFLLLLALNITLGAFFAGLRFDPFHPFAVSSGMLFAGIFAAATWLGLEPDLLRPSNGESSPLTLDFIVANAVGAADDQSIETQSGMENQVAIITSALFFLIQLVVYFVCLMRLAQIREEDSPAQLKLKLLENEENLFDLGLYVGLGGTVLSLILLAMRIVEASLIAAYASTLFGIVFVALLKIFHVRPYRRDLIIEVEEG